MGKKSYGRPFSPTCLGFLSGRDDVFVAGGSNALQMWTVDREAKKMESSYVGLGKLKRNIRNMTVCPPQLLLHLSVNDI